MGRPNKKIEEVEKRSLLSGCGNARRDRRPALATRGSHPIGDRSTGKPSGLADATTIERSISEAYVVLPQGEAHTPVVLGEDGDQALLGVVTLEILGLVFNPFDRTLQPMRMLLC
jgi:hypothetical protein